MLIWPLNSFYLQQKEVISMSHFLPKPYQTEAITIRVHIDPLDSILQTCSLLH